MIVPPNALPLSCAAPIERNIIRLLLGAKIAAIILDAQRRQLQRRVGPKVDRPRALRTTGIRRKPGTTGVTRRPARRALLGGPARRALLGGPARRAIPGKLARRALLGGPARRAIPGKLARRAILGSPAQATSHPGDVIGVVRAYERREQNNGHPSAQRWRSAARAVHPTHRSPPPAKMPTILSSARRRGSAGTRCWARAWYRSPPEHPPVRLLLPTLTGTTLASAGEGAVCGRGSIPTTLPNRHSPTLTGITFICHGRPYHGAQPAGTSIDRNDVREPADLWITLSPATSFRHPSGSDRRSICDYIHRAGRWS